MCRKYCLYALFNATNQHDEVSMKRVYEIACSDLEHVDGTAWHTTRVCRDVAQAIRAARNWLEQVKACGAPVYDALVKIDGQWTRV